ncbi:cytochrome c [Paraburkholderia sp. Ac-20340]|uniref:c-type cytochrome n=1 Tax=Paraburkholderia sp. Ac-20340 TaxID=2703888 RepID=UPI0019821D75|nr:cytochrome c [Paraburkholderia sp. Ac-20340]MBN3855012.1 cytochrome c [Paraburkholderia sp. Ac-20340]
MSIRQNAVIALCSISACFTLLALAALCYMFSGHVAVAATSKDNRLVAWLLHTTYQHSLDRQSASVVVPAHLETTEYIAAGAKLYAQHCVYCHGAPGAAPDAIGAGIAPQAPKLLAAARKNSPQSTYWVMRHGVKMTAMPAFGKSLPDSDLWKLAAFLHAGKGIDAAHYAALLN